MNSNLHEKSINTNKLRFYSTFKDIKNYKSQDLKSCVLWDVRVQVPSRVQKKPLIID